MNSQQRNAILTAVAADIRAAYGPGLDGPASMAVELVFKRLDDETEAIQAQAVDYVEGQAERISELEQGLGEVLASFKQRRSDDAWTSSSIADTRFSAWKGLIQP